MGTLSQVFDRGVLLLFLSRAQVSSRQTERTLHNDSALCLNVCCDWAWGCVEVRGSKQKITLSATRAPQGFCHVFWFEVLVHVLVQDTCSLKMSKHVMLNGGATLYQLVTVFVYPKSCCFAASEFRAIVRVRSCNCVVLLILCGFPFLLPLQLQSNHVDV